MIRTTFACMALSFTASAQMSQQDVQSALDSIASEVVGIRVHLDAIEDQEATLQQFIAEHGDGVTHEPPCEVDCENPDPDPDPLPGAVSLPAEPAGTYPVGAPAPNLAHYIGAIQSDPLWDPEGGVDLSWALNINTGANSSRRLGIFLHGSGAGGSTVTSPRTPFNGGFVIHSSDREIVGYRQWHWTSLGQRGLQNYAGEQMAALLDYVAARYASDIDLSYGITLFGTSMGATGAIHQATNMPDRWRQLLLKISANRGHTTIDNLVPRDNSGPMSPEWEAIDLRQLLAIDPFAQQPSYFGLNGIFDGIIPYDHSLVEALEANQISYCWGLYPGSHGISGSDWDYICPESERALGVPWPAFTNNSANLVYVDDPKSAAHYNMGLLWDLNTTVSMPGKLSLPIAYQPKASLGMDANTTADVTVHGWTPDGPVTWSYDVQTGVAVPDANGRITVRLAIPGDGVFRALEIRE